MNKDQRTQIYSGSLEDSQTHQLETEEIKRAAVELQKHRAALLAIAGAAVGQVFAVESLPLDIGRDRDCGICLPDNNVSRRHARLEKDRKGNLRIVDLGSTNGTFVNGKRVKKSVLRDGHKVQLGHQNILKFSYHDNIEATFHLKQYERTVRDGLTGTFNRRHLLVELRRELAYALRRREPFSLVLFDIDHFKRVNDTYGHQAGDAVLQQLARLVSESLREEDLLGRYGGEEFAIILRGADDQKAYDSAERVRRLVEAAEFTWEDRRIGVTISLGVASRASNELIDATKLVQAADQYLYAAKSGGRNQTASVINRPEGAG